jgi:hypothetical protein
MIRGEGVPRPQWRQEDLGRYLLTDSKRGAETSQHTNLLRVDTALNVLEQIIIPRLSAPCVNAVIIGPGLEDRPSLKNSLEAPFIAALLDNLGLDYTQLIIDIDQEVLDWIRQSKEIFLWTSIYDRSERIRELWDWYLKMVQGDIRTVERSYPGILNYSRPGNAEDFTYYRVAPLPTSFTTKIGDGQISFYTADIARADIPKGEFNYVLARNVLDKLPPEGQRLGLQIAADTLVSGVFIHINDCETRIYNPLFKMAGGWLTQDSWWLEEVDLSVVEIIENDISADDPRESWEIVLQKI